MTAEETERAFWESDLGRLNKRLLEPDKPFTSCLDALVDQAPAVRPGRAEFDNLFDAAMK